MAAAVQIAPPPAPSLHAKYNSQGAQSCPTCGTDVHTESREMENARRRIMDVEAQMELWKEKAAAADKCADYEDQIRSLKEERNREVFNTSRRSSDEPRPSTAGATSTMQSRFSFLTGRRSSPINPTSPPPPPPIPDIELLNELERERSLRAKAEERAQKVDNEIEELSVQLFSQANEMVATERKARAKLEERVEMLERKDKDKMARLDRLEKAVSRIDRVKAMLNQPPTAGLSAGSVMLAPPARR